MLQNLEDTASELLHYRARTVSIEHTRHKAHVGFNPRLGKDAKQIVFVGQTAQELKINPITGGYDLSQASAKMDSIDLTKDTKVTTGINTNLDNFNSGIPQTEITKDDDLNTDISLTKLKTTGSKKKKKSKKGKNKTKRKLKKKDNTDEPPKKKTKVSAVTDPLFSAPGADKPDQDLDEYDGNLNI